MAARMASRPIMPLRLGGLGGDGDCGIYEVVERLRGQDALGDPARRDRAAAEEKRENRVSLPGSPTSRAGDSNRSRASPLSPPLPIRHR